MDANVIIDDDGDGMFRLLGASQVESCIHASERKNVVEEDVIGDKLATTSPLVPLSSSNQLHVVHLSSCCCQRPVKLLHVNAQFHATTSSCPSM